MEVAFFVVTHDLYIYWFHRLDLTGAEIGDQRSARPSRQGNPLSRTVRAMTTLGRPEVKGR